MRPVRSETGTTWDSTSVQILVLVYMRLVRKISLDRSHSFRVLDRHEWIQTGSNLDRHKIFFMKTRNLSRSTINNTKNHKNIVAGNKNSECRLKCVQEHGFSSIPVSRKHFRIFSIWWWSEFVPVSCNQPLSCSKSLDRSLGDINSDLIIFWLSGVFPQGARTG